MTEELRLGAIRKTEELIQKQAETHALMHQILCRLRLDQELHLLNLTPEDVEHYVTGDCWVPWRDNRHTSYRIKWRNHFVGAELKPPSSEELVDVRLVQFKNPVPKP